MRRRWALRAGMAVAAAVVIAAGATFWWVFVRDDTPAEAQLVERATVTAPVSELDGTWAIGPGPEVFAGYRITEVAAGIDNTAVARTGAVDGSLTIAGSQITEVTVTADMSTLVSQDNQVPAVGNRDAAMRQSGLETDRFPTATFTLTSPIELATLPDPGEEVFVEAKGELELHGQTRPVTIPLSGRWNGEVIDLTGSLEVVLADYAIAPPAPDLVTIAEEGTLELQLTFAAA